MVETNGIVVVLVFLVISLLQSVSSKPICSEGSEIGRSVLLTGKHGGGTDCSCTLMVSSIDRFAVNIITFRETKIPVGCQYALSFKLGTSQRIYSCSQHSSSTQYSMYNDDIMTLKIVSGSTSSGGFDFSFNITSNTVASEITLTCQQTPPDPTASTVTPITTVLTSQTTTTSTNTSATTSSDQSTSSGGSGNSQTTVPGGQTTSSVGQTTSSGGQTTSSGGQTASSGGQVTSSSDQTTSGSGGGTSASNNKPPTPKPSVVATDDPVIFVMTTYEATPQSTEPTTVSTAAIIGATLGVILLFVLMVVVLLCFWKKKLNKNKVGAS